jgi:hypothetical protein
MNQEKEPLADVVGQLLQKSMEANKIFLQEGSRFIKQLGNKDATINTFSLLKSEALSRVVSEYVKLNLHHYNNLVDLGLNFIRQVNPTNDNAAPAADNAESFAPSFVLEKEVEAGQPLNFQFLLDNSKQETVKCELTHSSFTSEQELANPVQFSTVFIPMSFELQPGESRNVQIVIQVPPETAVGRYRSNVQVKGFDPAYFSMYVTVIESTKKSQPDGGKKHKAKRK